MILLGGAWLTINGLWPLVPLDIHAHAFGWTEAVDYLAHALGLGVCASWASDWLAWRRYDRADS